MNNGSVLDDFKGSELGSIPVDWEMVRLEEIADVRGGAAFPHKYQGQKEGKYPFYKVSDMNLLGNETYMRSANNWVGEETAKVLGAKPFPKKTVIFPKVGAAVHTNKKRILTTDALVDNNVMGVTVREEGERCVPEYLLYWFEYIDIGQFSNPGPLPSITARAVKNAVFPLPSLSEQRRIAHVLSTIQRAIAAQDDLIAAAREVKRSLMQRLFTYGPGPEPALTKETEIGEIPAHWGVVRLGEVCERPAYGYTASAMEAPIGPRFLRITDIQDGGVNWSLVPYCGCSDETAQKYKLQPGDILFARIGATTGKSYLVKECPSAIFASYLIRVRTKPRLFSGYLSQFVNSGAYWQQINASKGGRLKQGINIPVLVNLMLPFPPLDEQLAIASALDAVDRKIEAEEQRKAALQALFKAMLHQLMTGQIRVNAKDGGTDLEGPFQPKERSLYHVD